MGALLSVVNRPALFWGFVLFEHHESTLEGGLSFEASEQIEKKQNNTLRFELLTSTFWRGENETAAWWEMGVVQGKKGDVVLIFPSECLASRSEFSSHCLPLVRLLP